MAAPDAAPVPDGFAPGHHPPLWPRISSESGPNLLICRVRYDVVTNPRTGESMRRTVLETREWVNVIAFTKDSRLIVVRQFRFGSGTVTTELPGGVVDSGEEHEAAARRELREETGFTADQWSYLGCVEPNPATHTNRCHHWMARDAAHTHAPELDSGEDISTDSLTQAEVREAIVTGEINHALVVSALSRIMDLRSHPWNPS